MVRRLLKISFGMILFALVGAQLFQPERTNHPSDLTYSFEAVARPTCPMLRPS
jgi:hypothetical protein